MKIAATVLLCVAGFFVVDVISSDVSVNETIQSDYLNIDATQETQPSVEATDEEVIDGWKETIRRRRTRRQSRFC